MERMSEEEFINNIDRHITLLKDLDNKALKILVGKLEEENKNLKERIDELEKCNLNLQERLDNKEKVNKKLREELGEYKKMFEDQLKEVYIKNTAKFMDKKFPKVNGFMEEDTLQ